MPNSKEMELQKKIDNKIVELDDAIVQVNRLGRALMNMRYELTSATIDDEYLNDNLAQVATDVRAMADDAEGAYNFIANINEINFDMKD